MPSAAALEPVDAAAVSTDTASLTASLELSSGTRQSPTRSGLWGRAVVGLRFLAAVAVFVPIFSVPLVLPLPKHGTCLGGWPEFVSVAQLQAHEAWSRYVEGVYGSLHGTRVPTHCAWASCGSSTRRASPQQVSLSTSTCPRPTCARATRAVWRGSDTRRTRRSRRPIPRGRGTRRLTALRRSRPGRGWRCYTRGARRSAPRTPQPAPAVSPISSLGSGIADEHVGAWFLTAPGSGIWLNMGNRTIAFDDHADGWRHIRWMRTAPHLPPRTIVKLRPLLPRSATNSAARRLAAVSAARRLAASPARLRPPQG